MHFRASLILSFWSDAFNRGNFWWTFLSLWCCHHKNFPLNLSITLLSVGFTRCRNGCYSSFIHCFIVSLSNFELLYIFLFFYSVDNIFLLLFFRCRNPSLRMWNSHLVSQVTNYVVTAGPHGDRFLGFQFSKVCDCEAEKESKATFSLALFSICDLQSWERPIE